MCHKNVEPVIAAKEFTDDILALINILLQEMHGLISIKIRIAKIFKKKINQRTESTLL